MCMFTSNDAVKESVAHGSENNDSKFLLELIKRIGDPSYNYQSEDQEDSSRGDLSGKQSETSSNELPNLPACQSAIQQGSIIKTTESIRAGAVYIDSVKYVKSNDDCLGYCCQNSTCDVAVYQDKGDKYCYLFRCAGRCIFKSHVGYLVNTIMGRKSSEHPEEDLQNLNSEVIGSSSGGKKTAEDTVQSNPVPSNPVQSNPEKQEVVQAVSEQTTVRMISTTKVETPELVITPHSVGLGGYCTQDRQCEDPNAVCGHGNCVCSDAFYNKEGICRKVCLSSEFECFDLGTLARGTECIPQSKVCDSYLDCADGSDEFNCESITPSYQQTNWSQQSLPAMSSSKGNSQGGNLADSFTQPVVQEPVNGNHQKKTQDINPQTSLQGNAANEHEMGQNQPSNNLPLQNYNVRPQPTLSSKDSSMHLKQNVQSGSDLSQPPRPNLYPNTGFVENIPANSAHVSNTNINQARQNLVHHESNSQPVMPQDIVSAPKQQVDDLQQLNPVKVSGKTNSDSLTELSASSQTYQAGPQQISDLESSQQNLNKHNNQEPAHQANNMNAEPNTHHSSQFVGSHAMKSRPLPQTNDQESGLRSNVHLEKNGNTFQQHNQHVGKPLSPSHKSLSSSQKSFRPTNPQSQNPGNAPSRSRLKIPSSSKSHTSASDQLSQNHLSIPNYSNSQKWLDPSLYVPYSLGDSPSQQEQPQTPVGSHYFDSSQYYPPYSSDSIDPLPEALLENTGSNDDFSQFGGPDVGHGRSLGLPYSSQNSGYQGYPDPSYPGQYPPSRYDDNGDYRSPSYQDPDFYTSLGSRRTYRPSSGLYEEFPSGGVRPSKPDNSLHKSEGSQPLATEQKNNDAVISVQGQSTQAPKSEPHPTKLPPAASNKNKTGSLPSPSPSTHKPFPEVRGDKKHIFMSREKVIIASTRDAEGPIIALSLGLAFTLILLVLVGCRLKNVRHRLRKGRPLHQNEADYLINGMYL